MSLVSVIVFIDPNDFNLDRRLESLKEQSFRDLEIKFIVQTEHISEFQFFVSANNMDKLDIQVFDVSTIDLRSTILDTVAGEFIWILAGSGFADVNFLTRLLPQFENPEVGIVYSQSIYLDKSDQAVLHGIHETVAFDPNIWKSSFVMNGEDFASKYLRYKNVIPSTAAVLIRTRIFLDYLQTRDGLDYHQIGLSTFWEGICQDTSISFVSQPLNYIYKEKTFIKA